jgi:nicotinamide riboside kinase
MTPLPHPFELAVLAPASDVPDETRLFQLLFALSLGRRVIVAPKNLSDIAAWESCPYIGQYQSQVSVAPDRDKMVEEMLAEKTILVGADDSFSGVPERLGLPFMFVPTLFALPVPSAITTATSTSIETAMPRRVAIVGPECSGKSTLAQQLSAALGTVWVPEYSRLMLEFRGTPCTAEDLSAIILGQIALEDSLANFAHEYVICDTEPRLSEIWSQTLYHHFPKVYEARIARDYDRYLLTSPDLDWAPDSVRCLPHGGDDFFAACQELFSKTGRSVTIISGVGDVRFRDSIAAIRQNS